MLLRLVTEHVRSRNWTAVGIGLLIAVLACGPATASTEASTVRSDWTRHFAAAGVGGPLVVVDERTNPVSTFKIAHALFALEAGIVCDEFQVFRWDGTRREIGSWNRDQDLRSSMRNSAVWVERLEGPVFFALNIEMPNEGADLPKREAIARAVLRSIGALPPDSTPHASKGK